MWGGGEGRLKRGRGETEEGERGGEEREGKGEREAGERGGRGEEAGEEREGERARETERRGKEAGERGEGGVGWGRATDRSGMISDALCKRRVWPTIVSTVM